MKKHPLIFWLFLAPAVMAFLLVMVVPFAFGVYYSLTDWDGLKNAKFVGLANFAKILQNNPRFLYSVIITFVYSALNILLINAVALGLALLVTQKFRFTNVYRAGFFIPNLIGGLILGYIWQFIFNRVMPGALQNDFLMLAGRNTALLAIVIAGTWQYAGYIMMIYVTAIQNIPQALLEASTIDGANGLQRLRHIMIPMLAPAFTITTFLTLMYSFKQFDVNFSLTSGGPATLFKGQAIDGTELITMNIFNEAFSFYNMGLAQAKAVLFFFVLLGFSLVQVYWSKKKEIEA